MKVLSPTSGFPAWESSKRTRNPQGIWLWGPWDLITELSQDWEKQRLGRYKQNLAHTRTQGQGARLNKTYLLVLEGLLWQPRSAMAHCRDGDTGSRSPGRCPLGVNPLGGHHEPYHRAYRLQGWVASGQTINREGAQPHPSANNWVKVLLSQALPTRARPNFFPPLIPPISKLTQAS